MKMLLARDRKIEETYESRQTHDPCTKSVQIKISPLVADSEEGNKGDLYETAACSSLVSVAFWADAPPRHVSGDRAGYLCAELPIMHRSPCRRFDHHRKR